jgi:hypothetical protein
MNATANVIGLDIAKNVYVAVGQAETCGASWRENSAGGPGQQDGAGRVGTAGTRTQPCSGRVERHDRTGLREESTAVVCRQNRFFSEPVSFAKEEPRTDANRPDRRWVNPSFVAVFGAATLSGFQRGYCIRARAINRSTYRPSSYLQAYPTGKYLNSFLAKWVESIDTVSTPFRGIKGQKEID